MSKAKYLKSDWSKIGLGILIGAFLVCVFIYLKTSQILTGYSSNAAPIFNSYNAAIPEFPDLSRYDVDLSGQSNYDDAKFISAFVAGTGKPCPVARCDFSGDGRVTSNDAALLSKALIRVYDTDRNQRLDSNDPLYISRSVAGQVIPKCGVSRCDIDGSGRVTSYDAAILTQIINTFPH